MTYKLVLSQITADELYREFNLWRTAVCLDSKVVEKYTLVYKQYKENIIPATYIPFKYHFYKIILI